MLKLTVTKKAAPVVNVPNDVAIKLASEFRKVALEFDDVEARKKIARDALLEIVTERRDANLLNGNAETTVKIPTDDGNRVLVLYTEKYRDLPIENVAALRECFGQDYSLFAEESTSVSLRKNATLEDLEKAVGPKAWAALQSFLDVSQGVSPRKGAFDNIAALRKKGKAELAQDLTSFMDACITSPTVRAK